MTEYDKYHAFVQRIIYTTQRPEEIYAKLQRIATPTLVNLSEVASGFDDVTVQLCFEALVSYTKGLGQMGKIVEGHNEVREAKFIDAMVVLAPLMSCKPTSALSTHEKVKKLAMMASPVAESKIGISDLDVIRGYYLKSSSGYYEAPDWLVNQYRWLGQNFGLISEHWDLFTERRIFDREFVEQLASYDGSKPLSGGVL